jgi:hypothetical protein
MPAAPYTRILLDGIPFWKDNADGKLYYYSSAIHPTPENRIHLGSEAEGLTPDWEERLAPTLESYRTAAAAKDRPAPAASSKKKTPSA